MSEKTKAKPTRKSAKKAKGKHAFQAEVAKLLHLMVHSVYSEQEVFLRELISNAADACDKLRYEAIARPDLLAGDPDLSITIAPNSESGVLEIRDNGIGMDEAELISNLGTIARSGTQAFMEEAGKKNGKDAGEADEVNLIGQFGVGFYSAFMVAENVDVISRKAGTDQANIWSSDGTGEFTVQPYSGEDAPARGTVIRLKLRENCKEFNEGFRLETIIKTYSDHIAHPINLETPKTDDGEGGKRQINAASAIWSRPKSEVTAEQHKEFFGSLAGVFSDPALTLHYKAEGRTEYTVLMYVPEERPFDLFDPERRGRQKLYVRRVFITDDADMLPAYLRFVRGVIDSEDMPLNISREMLQDNPIVAQIREAVTKRVLNEIKKCAEKEPETFAKIWEAFGAVIKEGLHEDMARRDDLFEIVRFKTSKSEGETVSLKDYIENLRENQTAIYYITGEDAAGIARSPQLEGFKARGIEVLLLSDPVDNFWVRTALGYEGKPFTSITQGTDDLETIPLTDDDGKDGLDETATATLIAGIKEALGDKVQDVRKSARLTDSPVCLVAGEGGLDRTLEKLLSRQNTTNVSLSAPVLEINPRHALITALGDRLKASGKSDDIKEAAELLLDQAFILDGEQVPEPQAFAQRLSDVMMTLYSSAK